MSIIKEVLVIDKMLTELGYDTEKITVDEVLEIRKVIKKVVSKVQLPLSE